MNEEETYTLRQPIEVHITAPDEMWIPALEVTLDQEDFDELFVPVSEYKERLRERIISYNGHAQIEAKNPDGTVAELTVRFADPDTLIDEILGLVGLSNTPEQKEK